MNPAYDFKSGPTLATVQRLLRAAELPASDLTEAQLDHFFYEGPVDAPRALAGAEVFGPNALLRSVLVSASARSCGLGSAIVAHVESHLRTRGVRSVYLLTTTAATFFERLGYRHVDRTEAPQDIRTSGEFASLCPASSAFMLKTL